ncbi:hypothetical protein OSO01_19420 [Oceanobacillus sojae]|uniref:Major facilitator superfamily (MFS) profile domain-containing protein n=1 Tax=Oceanobacillus sojae TaxID=582851 RepID=A0A511ZID0_9BACI|nr:hypothetical protein OSO01_19420 [Oceanobacillus sojae]
MIGIKYLITALISLIGGFTMIYVSDRLEKKRLFSKGFLKVVVLGSVLLAFLIVLMLLLALVELFS